jgi:cytochrome c biogenesis factor
VIGAGHPKVPFAVEAASLLALVAGAWSVIRGGRLLLLAFESDVQAETGLSPLAAGTLGVLVLFVGVGLMLLCIGLQRGSRQARTIFGVVLALSIVIHAVLLFVGFVGSQVAAGMAIAVNITAFVLVYGTTSARRFFRT